MDIRAILTAAKFPYRAATCDAHGVYEVTFPHAAGRVELRAVLRKAGVVFTEVGRGHEAASGEWSMRFTIGQA